MLIVAVCKETHLTNAFRPTEKPTTANAKAKNSEIDLGILKGVSGIMIVVASCSR